MEGAGLTAARDPQRSTGAAAGAGTGRTMGADADAGTDTDADAGTDAARAMVDLSSTMGFRNSGGANSTALPNQIGKGSRAVALRVMTARSGIFVPLPATDRRLF